ncbi:MAG: hypothetical protein CVU65_04900 [Deltaproteobacteria bacterium HGW-Deltaproteobacteria-22]|jgi:cysteine-rich repeat protein|nr:MAG: hypothetical protein CVU65_04900 [Deltaproteobacteria bacterium HGW-Deltaproteobacteria-22]
MAMLFSTHRTFFFCLGLVILALSGCKTKVSTQEHCGDGFVDPGEECDGPELGEATCGTLGYYDTLAQLTCASDCMFDVSLCGERCGDNRVDIGRGEQCDSLQLNGQTCQTQGYAGGTLLCSAGCQFDFASCTSACGDRVQQPGEGCDDGNRAAGDGCDPGCQIEDGWSCTEGLCTEICGDGTVIGQETCDGTNLGLVQDCTDAGFYRGEPACGDDCRLDLSGCEGRCGDEIAESFEGEACDGADLAGLTCGDYGFYHGELTCSESCAVSTDDCLGTCGDGQTDLADGEECDLSTGGRDCEFFRLPGGLLACSDTCSFDRSACLTWAQVSAGGNHTCARRSDDTVWCWGDNTYGQLGDATLFPRLTPVQVKGVGGAGFLGGIVSLHAGGSHTCALASSGAALCWGYNGNGRLGTGNTVNSNTPLFVRNPANTGTLVDVAFLHAGPRHSCAGTNAGILYCWGFNNEGQLGTGDSGDRNLPGLVSTVNGGYLSVACGEAHTCAAREEGGVSGVYCWGRNNHGQLGIGTVSSALTPQLITSPVGFIARELAAGANHTCARATNDSGYCWGDATYGKLGNLRTTPDVLVPGGIHGFHSGTTFFVVVGSDHSCGFFLETSGVPPVTHMRAMCWGSNLYGQLGDGTTNDSTFPQAVATLGEDEPLQLSALGTHTCLLDTVGRIRCWGANAFGQLGNNSLVSSEVPVWIEVP